MGYLRFNYRSQAIGHYVDISIVYPTDRLMYYDETTVKPLHISLPFPEKEKKSRYRPGMKFQTVYLIHGGGDDDTLTYRYTNAERYAQENMVMLVTPDIPNSFGIDTDYGIPYQTFLSDELPVVIQSLFASSGKREDNFIVGYAMGGNVALGTALLHPERFRTCVDISGGVGMTVETETLVKELEGDYYRNHFQLFNRSFGEGSKIPGSVYDIRAAALRHMKNGDLLTELIICCGSEEFIRERVEGDVKALKEIGYPCRYICAQGYAHNFSMWDDYLRITLDELLPLKRQVIFPEEETGENDR